ncbi:uncharacterized protein LOC118735437 [Rhagoletis pomonella]|uniref:uncharacterized protein LOC118735437 n=1 Tax=Rhagoletis pomonella TaxID=28610 RepID=UPI0017813B9C|nr:uncharacterized protein LOC118735437 [Rhagoletis pomonella]
MSIFTFKYLFLIVTLFKAQLISTAPNVVNQKQQTNLSITEDYKTLRDDAQWLFQHIEFIADSLVQILPAVNRESGRSLQGTVSNATLVENTRLTLLLGLRHVLVGIKEIAVSFQRRLSGDHEQQLIHIKMVTQLIQDILRFAKHLFSMLRNSLSEIFRIYNRYIPEVLLGKCFSKYITTAYPDRNIYEYPFILTGEVIDFAIAYLQNLPIYDAANQSPISKLETADISDEQNEIWPNEMDKYSRSLDLPVDRNGRQTSTESSPHPWQKCLKMYAADTISRQLKLFFIGD